MDPHPVQPVESTDPRPSISLAVSRSDPSAPLGLPPILMLHGFGSSAVRNWVDTGWVRFLNDAGRAVIMVDLPAHGLSAVPLKAGALAPSRMRADILQALVDERVRPLNDGDTGSGVDIIGYSLGARLAWEFGAAQPDMVRRMVLGGPGTADPLADFDLDGAAHALDGGPPPRDPMTADLLRMAQAVPGNDLPALLALASAVRTEPFDPPSAVPGMPLLLVAGDQDQYATGIEDLAEWSPDARIVTLAGRNHANAVTSRAFKNATLTFLT